MNWIPIVSLLITIFVTGFNVAMFIVIKFNDLHHLTKKVDIICTKLDDIDKKLDNNAERISNIEGRCQANHG